jgi:hypothetical protein
MLMLCTAQTLFPCRCRPLQLPHARRHDTALDSGRITGIDALPVYVGHRRSAAGHEASPARHRAWRRSCALPRRGCALPGHGDRRRRNQPRHRPSRPEGPAPGQGATPDALARSWCRGGQPSADTGSPRISHQPSLMCSRRMCATSPRRWPVRRIRPRRGTPCSARHRHRSEIYRRLLFVHGPLVGRRLPPRKKPRLPAGRCN